MKFNVTVRKKLVSGVFLLPAAFVSALFIAYPIFLVIRLSFQKVKMIGSNTANAPYTLDNYINIFSNPAFWDSMWKTLLFTFLGTFISFIIGMYTALFLNKKFTGRVLARSLIMLPWPIPAIAVSIIFIWMLNANFGIVNHILYSLKIIPENIAWLTTANYAFLSVVAASVWKAYPFFTLMLLAGLQNIPHELYEASDIDGANVVQQFIHITFPALLNVSTVSFLLNGVWFFKNFDIIYGMTGGGPARSTELLSVKLYFEAFQYYKMGVASAIGVVCLLICILMVLVLSPLLNKEFY